MPTLKIPGCDRTFTQCPEARDFILANYRTMSLRDMTIATKVAYHNVAQFMYTRNLMADRYTVKRRNVQQLAALSTHEMAYVAGIVDGEGTITVQMRGTYSRPDVTISNTSFLLRDWFTMRGFTAHMALNSVGRWYWRISWGGYAVDTLLTAMRPYLVIKARHADLLSEFIILRRAQSKREPPTARMLEIAGTFRWLNERMLTCEERERRDVSSTL